MSQSNVNQLLSDMENGYSQKEICENLGLKMMNQMIGLTVLIGIMSKFPLVLKQHDIQILETIKPATLERLTNCGPTTVGIVHMLISRPQKDKAKSFIYRIAFSYIMKEMLKDDTVGFILLTFFGIGHFMNNNGGTKAKATLQSLAFFTGTTASNLNAWIDEIGTERLQKIFCPVRVTPTHDDIV